MWQVNYVEALLRTQLTAAIGKDLTPADFRGYMRHHERRIYSAEYAPQPFCFAVRRAGHSPEGTLAIEGSNLYSDDASADEPINTMCRSFAAPAPPMSFALDAATRVTFGGERHLHAHMARQRPLVKLACQLGGARLARRGARLTRRGARRGGLTTAGAPFPGRPLPRTFPEPSQNLPRTLAGAPFPGRPTRSAARAPPRSPSRCARGSSRASSSSSGGSGPTAPSSPRTRSLCATRTRSASR